MLNHPEVLTRLARDVDRERLRAAERARIWHRFRSSAPSEPTGSARPVGAGAARVRAQG
jgi:hypothetical protein